MSTSFIQFEGLVRKEEHSEFFSLILSLLVHAVLVALLVLIVLTRPQPNFFGDSSPIEVDSIDVKQAKTKKFGLPKESVASSLSQDLAKVIPLSALGMRLDSGNHAPSREENRPEQNRTLAEEGNLLQVDPTVMNEDPSFLRVANYLDRTINGAMKYYSRYFRENMNGMVKVNLCFSEQGEYLGTDAEHGSTFEAEDRDFKALAAMIVKRELKEPIPKPLLSGHKRFCIPGYFTKKG